MDTATGNDSPEFPRARIRIAPSILSADLARLAEEVAEVEAGGADLLHVDVMDGHFVPNLTVGVPVVAGLRRVTHLPLDVHLMIDNPWDFVEPFADAGADSLSVHVELDAERIARTIDHIHQLGKRATLVINPETPVEAASWALGCGTGCWSTGAQERHGLQATRATPGADMVLVMSVRPGFGGQRFIPEVLPKVAWLRERLGPGADIEIDGGLSPETVRPAVAHGANVIVAGSAIFGRPDRAAALRAIRQAATQEESASSDADGNTRI